MTKKQGRQGAGGGRPRREGETTRINLDVSARAGELLRAEAERTGRPLWVVLDGLVLKHLPMATPKPLDDSQAIAAVQLLDPNLAPAKARELLRLKQLVRKLPAGGSNEPKKPKK